MAMPVPLAGEVELCLMDIEAQIRRARVDGVIEHREAEAIFAQVTGQLKPRVTLMTTTLAVVKSMLTSDEGCNGHRVQRMLKTVWQRPGNVIAFPANEGGGEAA